MVAAARHFLETHDPQEISFKEIAKYAKVPEGSAYHFFANKYDLFSALAPELGVSFDREISKPFNKEHIRSWQEFVALVIDRAASIYRADPVARKVLLGKTMPNEVKHVDHESIEKYVTTVVALLNEMFEIPPGSRLRVRLIYALTMIDALFELDLSRHKNLSDEIIQEATLMMVGYLSNFIPPGLESKMSC